ncbi:cytochrome c oxidase subunit II [Yinghuangia seranimata]|uniref:aa3-type cytochrome oxidase subunit II n=1 Tax=Yinghuangia seranimata TaxID=408067 RepID=UPI00248C52C7|nr:cytochrome c oxidase subunit II [Yinghuangia seranimata]MDI2126095.1 cytochrome c oxidase subunit II [Yinghuangia seranimata]
MSPYGSDRSPRRWMRRRVPQLLALGLVTATATGCSVDSKDLPRLGLPSPATEQGHRVLALWQGSWIAALIVGAVVWGLILWSVVFHRRSRTKQEIPPQTRYNLPLEVLYTVIPGIIIAVFFYFTARDETKLQATTPKTDPAFASVNVIEVVGYQWNWAFNYKDGALNSAGPVYESGTPARMPTLWLPQGQKVQFLLNSPDVIHSFWVPAFLYKQDIIPGKTNKFEITPQVLGEYDGRCAELCGADHSRMLFKVKIVTPEEYQRHLAELKAIGNTGGVRSTVNMPATVEHTPGSEK